MSILYRRTLTIFGAILIIMKTVVESDFPEERDATSNINEVRCVGLVLNKKASSKCQGTFLTQKHLATSCRCIGDTDKTTGVYTQGNPSNYEVKSWSKGVTEETQAVERLYFYYSCGIEPNKVWLDLGLVETSSPFSEGAVEPAALPDADLFRFYEYIYRIQILQTRCMSTSDSLPAGSVLNMTAKPNFNCPKKATCQGTNRTNCELITQQTNYICAVPPPKVTTPAPDVPPPEVYEPCKASAGAPLLCHKMLVGINGRSADCAEPYNSYMFVRMDYTMNWLNSLIC